MPHRKEKTIKVKKFQFGAFLGNSCGGSLTSGGGAQTSQGDIFGVGGGIPPPPRDGGNPPSSATETRRRGTVAAPGGGGPGGSQPDLCRPTDAPKPRGDPAGVGPWALPGRAGCGGGCGARWLAELPTSSTTTPPPRYLEGLEIGARGGRGGQGTQASRPHGDTWLGLGGGNQFFQCPPVLPNPSQCSTVTLNLSQWPPVPPIPLSAPPIPVLQSFPVPCNSSQCPPSAAQ